MCRLDSGRISPDPPHRNEIWDYEGYIRWLESHHGKWSEAMPIVNKQTIQYVLFPEDKAYTGETQYHLDFTYRYKVIACDDVLRRYHLDAENNTWHPNIKRTILNSAIFAARLQKIVAVHGNSIRKWAPQTYAMLLTGMLTQLLLSGQKKKAWGIFKQALNMGSCNPRTWVIMLFGIINPFLLACLKATYSRISFLSTSASITNSL